MVPVPQVGLVEERPPKLFTVDEVDALVPRLEEIFRELDGIVARIRETTELLRDLEEYWGEAVFTQTGDDQAEYERLESTLEEQVGKYRTAVDAIDALGGLLNDYETGLIDFYTERQGKLALLCWKRGERAVEFWHPLETGFAGRQPVE